eukprot:870767-Pyramimonas_sp.AAC.1
MVVRYPPRPGGSSMEEWTLARNLVNSLVVNALLALEEEEEIEEIEEPNRPNAADCDAAEPTEPRTPWVNQPRAHPCPSE